MGDDDWVGGFFLDDATICFLLFASLENKLVLMVLAFGGGEGFSDKEGLKVEEGELLRLSSFFELVLW